MINQIRVTVIPMPSGCIFINEEGERDTYVGLEIVEPFLALLEVAAGPVTIEFPVELPEGMVTAVDGYSWGG